jgi:hypothetical protein
MKPLLRVYFIAVVQEQFRIGSKSASLVVVTIEEAVTAIACFNFF